ncbi:PEP/pyruvate-binding domain-containing protein [Kocuria nitroreducens]|uniref:PEP/pyruvate-binding domain-containing protein n=1 Tax=Kocuria nitroreducens TaxID=3058914 RepID=UPI0036DE4951
MDSAQPHPGLLGGPVVDLAELGRVPLDAALDPAGGKAARLGAMLAAGLPVPPGFCVTTRAYRRAAADAGLDRLLATPGTPPSRLRAALEAVPVPADVADAVRAAYADLGRAHPVAVRSSATAEDSPEASSAGQQDTYLNVVGEEAVLDAVRRCWASLWTDRAVAYRQDHGVEESALGLAVVVQSMVAAEVSGVLFTADPLTGRRGRSVVDAAPGLGEALVGGALDPDRFVLETATGRVLERVPGGKRTEVRPAPGGGTERVRRASRADRLCLTDEQVRTLAALGARAEQLFGTPQDLEWAIGTDGRVLLVQSRPVTTLYPLPPAAGTGDRVYLCVSLLQGLTRPLTPMGIAVFQAIADGWLPQDAGPDVLAARYVQAGMRLFVDATPLLRSETGRWFAVRMAHVADTRSEAVLRSLMADARFAVPPSRRRSSPAQLLRGLPQLGATPHVLAALFRPEAAVRRGERAEQELRALLVVDETAPAAHRLDLVERVLRREVVPFLMRQLPAPAAGYVWLGLARWLLRPVAEPGELAGVLRGLPHNVTTEMDLRLWRAAVAVRADPGSARALREDDPRDLAARYAEGSIPTALQEVLRDVLAEYGHRAVAEIDIGVPRWSEDPAHVLNVLANYLRSDDPERAPDLQFARAAEGAEALAADLSSRARAHGALRGALAARALRRVRRTAGLREQPKFTLIVVLTALRHQLVLVGQELAAAGRIGTPSDVFFLDLAEVRAGLEGADLHEPVAARRREYERELHRRRVPRVLLSDGTDAEAAMAAGSEADRALPPGTLHGAPASAGTATGTARVVLDPAAAHLEPGEVLVAPSTDPGWTPLFLTAAALVMEMGGPISHGAVVAREYGIPAVVGVPEATLRIATGDVVTVDGAAGTVVVHPGGSAAA